jgi:hypothetical protein
LKAEGVDEDLTMTKRKLLLGGGACVFGLIGQFYPVPLEDAKPVLIFCVLMYFALIGMMNGLSFLMHRAMIAQTVENKALKIPKLEVRMDNRRGEADFTLSLHDRADSKRSASVKSAITQFFDDKGYFLQDKYRAFVSQLLKDFLNKKSQ